MVAFKAFGLECDQEIIEAIGADDKFTCLLAPSIEDCQKEQIFTQTQVSSLLFVLE